MGKSIWKIFKFSDQFSNAAFFHAFIILKEKKLVFLAKFQNRARRTWLTLSRILSSRPAEKHAVSNINDIIIQDWI